MNAPVGNAAVNDKLRSLQCRVAEFFGLDYCMCHGGWQRKSHMDSQIDGLCRKCGSFVWIDRLTERLGLHRVTS